MHDYIEFNRWPFSLANLILLTIFMVAFEKLHETKFEIKKSSNVN